MLRGSRGGIFYYGGDLHLLTLPGSLPPTAEEFVFCADTVLDQNVIQQNLKRFHVSENSQSVLLFDDFEHSIATSADVLPLLESADQEDIRRMTLRGQPCIVIPYFSAALHAKYLQVIPERDVLASTQKLSYQFLLFASAVSLLTVIYCIVLYRMIKKPADQLIDALRQVENENFGTKLPAGNLQEFATIYAAFNRMTGKLKYLIDNIYIQKILVQKADLRQLQTQINPHFLYNSFFILKKRITTAEYEEAKQLADMLGMYFKYITKNGSDFTTLSEELSHAKIYADIQASRFKDRVTVKWGQVPSEYENLRVPRLILQPILENAFKYGLEDVEFDGILQVSFEKQGEYLLIHIEDNSEGYQKNLSQISNLRQCLSGEALETETSGLINIHRRLQLFFGDPECGLTLEQSELGGLRVTMKLSEKASVVSMS